jgi:hypothetical protein
MQISLLFVLFIGLIVVHARPRDLISYVQNIGFTTKKIALTTLAAASLTFQPLQIQAKENEDIPIERYFSTIRRELDPIQGDSLQRIRKDIETEDWKDLKLFTRQFDAGFRGTVLKGVWKKLDGENKRRGIELSNSFTFDLIAINKAAREGDAKEAMRRLDMVEADMRNFLSLENSIKEDSKPENASITNGD